MISEDDQKSAPRNADEPGAAGEGGGRTAADSRMLLSTLLDHIPDHVYFKDCQSCFLLINRAMAKSFGLAEPDEALGKSDFDFFSSEHAVQAFKDEQEILRTGTPLVGQEEKETWPDGRVTWVSTTKIPLTDESGEIVGTFGLSRDITAHREAELALERSETELRQHKQNLEKLVSERTAELRAANERLKSEVAERARIEESLRRERNVAAQYLRIAGVIFVALDGKGVVTLINQKGCEVLGLPEQDIVGKNWFDHFVPERLRAELRDVALRVMTGERNMVEAHESPVVAANGQERLILWHNSLLTDADGKIVGTLSSGEDITERRRMALAQRESERLEAVGNLARGVAYNYNTILSVIMGRAHSVAESLIPGSRPHADVLRILDAARHAGHLTKRLISVAGASRSGAESRIAPVPVAQVVHDAAELTEETFAEFDVSLDMRQPGSMPSVLADAEQLVEAIMNVLLNSAEAMPNGGSVRVDCIERHIASPRSNPEAPGGAFVGIRIMDTGEGMTRGVLARIFDPFFSTKSPERSFGLGLSVAQRTVKAMGGWIDVRSRRGKGTVFRVFLPKAETASADGAAASAAQPGAGKRLLLIDDDPEMIDALSAMLEEMGFFIVSACDAEDGIRMFERQADRIDVTVVDLLMPGKNGREVIEAILRIDPDASFVVTSGFSRDYVRDRVPVGAWAFLQKPFIPEQVSEVIMRALPDGKNKQDAAE